VPPLGSGTGSTGQHWEQHWEMLGPAGEHWDPCWLSAAWDSTRSSTRSQWGL
jgi:hypothetical protein